MMEGFIVPVLSGVVAGIISGALTSIGTVKVLANDVVWIKQMFESQSKDIKDLYQHRETDMRELHRRISERMTEHLRQYHDRN